MEAELITALKEMLKHCGTLSDGSQYVGHGDFAHIPTNDFVVTRAQSLRNQADAIEARDRAIYNAAQVLKRTEEPHGWRRTRLSSAIKYAIPARVRWQMFRFASKRKWRNIASWLLIDRRPLTPELIAYGQELWAEMQARDSAN